MDFFNQISFGPNIFLTKTTSMSTTTIKMGFDTTEINLVGSVTAEILLPRNSWWILVVGGGGWWGVVACKLILVFTLSLSQAEQFL